MCGGTVTEIPVARGPTHHESCELVVKVFVFCIILCLPLHLPVTSCRDSLLVHKKDELCLAFPGLLHLSLAEPSLLHMAPKTLTETAASL